MQRGVGQQFPHPDLLVHRHFIVKQVQLSEPFQPAQGRGEVADHVGPEDEALEVLQCIDVFGDAFNLIVCEVEFAQG